MDVKLGTRQYTILHLDGLEAFQESGKFTQKPNWSCHDNTLVSITPEEDGLSCRVDSGNRTGKTSIVVSDSNDSTTPTLTFQIHVGAQSANHFGVTIEQPKDLDSEDDDTNLPNSDAPSEPKNPADRSGVSTGTPHDAVPGGASKPGPTGGPAAGETPVQSA